MNTEIIIIGSENPELFIKFWAEEHFQFIGLPDPEHIVQNLYGQEVKLLQLGRMPAQVLVDQSGMVQYVHYGDSMGDIPSNKTIMDLIKR